MLKNEYHPLKLQWYMVYSHGTHKKKNGLDKAAKAQSQIVLSHVLTICQLECKSKEVGLDRSGWFLQDSHAFNVILPVGWVRHF